VIPIEQVVLATWRDEQTQTAYAVAATLLAREPVLLAVAATGPAGERIRTLPMEVTLGDLVAHWAGAGPEALTARAEQVLAGA
jgi:hypothetical protein